jgi:hypothetical protein
MRTAETRSRCRRSAKGSRLRRDSVEVRACRNRLDFVRGFITVYNKVYAVLMVQYDVKASGW